jgi:hypothetical protein
MDFKKLCIKNGGNIKMKVSLRLSTTYWSSESQIKPIVNLELDGVYRSASRSLRFTPAIGYEVGLKNKYLTRLGIRLFANMHLNANISISGLLLNVIHIFSLSVHKQHKLEEHERYIRGFAFPEYLYSFNISSHPHQRRPHTSARLLRHFRYQN